ncbi:outer membrane lipoprotein carrier protein LolA [Christiangramia fulva]|uniref:Outer membrane lipoprotein carrier protein LolA n=1 Tax=Christiangramia fulva TaxID=2126553 RepID=A0A2R3Z846_9FLAO|nr:outer membrane lipoprotein carrier protein LolA [Christiangramia fulva]AVR46415.1 outer membrane lipoprotein carrier protein LolA [Christiangramia fulva]
MRIIKICLFLASISMFSQNPLSENAESNFKSAVVRKANNINSFSAEFIQVKHMKMMDENPQSKGRVYYKSPNMLKWEYTAPYDYQVLFKDSKLYLLENGELSEVDLSGNKLFAQIGELIAGSLNGKILEADKDFRINFFRINNEIKARIVPNESHLSSMFKEIWLNFDENQLIKSVRLIDPSGDYTEISMKNIEINQPISPAVFQN